MAATFFGESEAAKAARAMLRLSVRLSLENHARFARL